MAGFLAHLALQEGRQLQFIEAEHRERQHDEDQCKTTQHPGVLQRGREQGAGHAGGDAGGGVGERHAEHVGQREQEGAGVRGLVPRADDDAGEDGDHREDAGCQREQQAEAEEAGDHDPEAGVLEQLRDLAGLSSPLPAVTEVSGAAAGVLAGSGKVRLTVCTCGG